MMGSPRRLGLLLLLALCLGVFAWTLTGKEAARGPSSNQAPVTQTPSPPPPQLDPAQASTLPPQPSQLPDSDQEDQPAAARTAVSEFEHFDQKRLETVNSVLEYEQFPPISPTATINTADLAAFRDIVDRANRDVVDAEHRWGNLSGALLHPMEEDLLNNLAIGQTTGLPEEGPDNSTRRRTRYEAISIVSYEGKTYVLRVGVDEVPELITLGQAIDVSLRRRTADFNTRVRGLFQQRR